MAPADTGLCPVVAVHEGVDDIVEDIVAPHRHNAVDRAQVKRLDVVLELRGRADLEHLRLDPSRIAHGPADRVR